MASANARRVLTGLASIASAAAAEGTALQRAATVGVSGSAAATGRHSVSALPTPETVSGSRGFFSGNNSASISKNFGSSGRLGSRLPAAETSTTGRLGGVQLAVPSDPLIRTGSFQTRLQSTSSGSSDTQRQSGGLAEELLRKKAAEEAGANSGRQNTEEGQEGSEEQQQQRPEEEGPAGNVWKAWGSIALMGAVGVVLVTGWPGKGDSWTEGWLTRSKASLESFYKYYTEPAAIKLLPDPLPEPYSRPMTLVINLNDTLVHMDWTAEHGWRAAKRPGLNYFIAYLSQLYEIVVFTTSINHEADALLNKLDPYGYIMYRLYRDSTRYEDGKYVKDLSHLNRDLAKVIAIDISEEKLKEQPENSIILKPWKGDPNDSTLLDLIPFFETVVLSGLDDVRTILPSYKGKDIPTAFAEQQKRIRADYEDYMKKKQPAQTTRRAGLFSRLLGGGALQQQQQQPLSPFDIQEQQLKELRAQFLVDQESFYKQAEEARKKQLEEYQRQMEEMKNKKMSLVDWFSQQAGGPPPQQGQQPGQ